VDLFRRPDGTHGFEEFRRDAEDAGAWTPMHYYSGASFTSQAAALAAARQTVAWLGEQLGAQAGDQPPPAAAEE
jgi:hypothetical protein